MRNWTKVLLLFAISAALEIAFVGVYYYQATGPLADVIASHTQSLESSTIPPASEIDIENDTWVKVAHFESTFWQVRLVVDTLFGLVIAWILVASSLNTAIVARARRLSPNIHLSRALYFMMIAALYALINFPVAVSTYVIETLRGTSFGPPESMLFMTVQDFVVGTIFVVLMFVPFYWIMQRFQKWWWAIGAVFMSLFTVFTVFIGPVLIDPLYYQVTPLEEGVVRETIRDVVEASGVSMDRVFVSDVGTVSYESNAMVTGLWGTERIILDDTLITFFTPQEIRTIVAHELGHYVLKHLWQDMLLMTLLTFVEFFLLALAIRFTLRRYGSRLAATHVYDLALYPIVSTLLLVIPMITSPILSYQHRALEHQADVYEVTLANDPAASINSFKKMAYQSFADVDPPKLLQFWFGTHPTIKERIEFYRSQQ